MRALARTWFVLLTALLGAAAASAATRVVVVRGYNTYGVSPPDLRGAARTVSQLLSAAGIESRWRNCRIAGKPATVKDDPCAEPPAPNELIVRLVGGVPPAAGASAALGYSFIDPVLKTGTLATIYADRVGNVSRAFGVDRGTMLGRAVAHEVAHLLLGSQSHAPAGLMRRLWVAMPSTAGRIDDWQFSGEQGLDLRSGLDARLARRATPAVAVARGK